MWRPFWRLCRYKDVIVPAVQKRKQSWGSDALTDPRAGWTCHHTLMQEKSILDSISQSSLISSCCCKIEKQSWIYWCPCHHIPAVQVVDCPQDPGFKLSLHNPSRMSKRVTQTQSWWMAGEKQWAKDKTGEVKLLCSTYWKIGLRN